MACEPLSVLILSTCLIAFWPCVLPLCFAVPILPYPMYFSKNDTEASESNVNQEKIKISVEKKKSKKSESIPVKDEVIEVKEVKEVRDVKEEVQTEVPEPIGPSKGTLVPEKKKKKTKSKFDSSDENSTSYDSEEECCTNTNCKNKNVGGRDLREFDMECDLCGRYRANIYYDTDDAETDTETDEIIVIPKKKPKMVNKKTKTNKIVMKGSGDKCNCANRNFGRTTRREDQLSCLTSRNFVVLK